MNYRTEDLLERQQLQGNAARCKFSIQSQFSQMSIFKKIQKIFNLGEACDG